MITAVGPLWLCNTKKDACAKSYLFHYIYWYTGFIPSWKQSKTNVQMVHLFPVQFHFLFHSV